MNDNSIKMNESSLENMDSSIISIPANDNIKIYNSHIEFA
jgi:hypothetical protein